jgi:hypothetical protein
MIDKEILAAAGHFFLSQMQILLILIDQLKSHHVTYTSVSSYPTENFFKISL